MIQIIVKDLNGGRWVQYPLDVEALKGRKFDLGDGREFEVTEVVGYRITAKEVEVDE